jgi:GNAT superfamily N-acetyltransferase
VPHVTPVFLLEHSALQFAQMRIRSALPDDNKQLVALARLTPMRADITICIQRDPDFFSLLSKKGNSEVLVAEEQGIIIGCVSIVKQEMVFRDISIPVHYICDLKVHPDHRGKKVGTMLCHAMKDLLVSWNADLVFCTVADGNQKVMPIVFGKGGIEGGIDMGLFYVLQMVPKKSYVNTAGTQCESLTDLDMVHDFYRQFNKRYALSPVLVPDLFSGCYHFRAVKNGQTTAMISLIDPIGMKQNVLVDFPWYYQVAFKFLALARPVLKTPHLPNKGEAIRILYVKAFGFLPDQEKSFLSLLEYTLAHAYHQNYSFLSIALHENDPVRTKLKSYTSFPFRSKLFFSSLKNNFSLLETMASANITIDYSLI